MKFLEKLNPFKGNPKNPLDTGRHHEVVVPDIVDPKGPKLQQKGKDDTPVSAGPVEEVAIPKSPSIISDLSN